MKTTIIARFKGEIEIVWEYADEPGKPVWSAPHIQVLQPGGVIPYHWKTVSLTVVQE